MDMFFVTRPDDRPDGYVNLSDSAQWTRWLVGNIPGDLHTDVRKRLVSNLKHLLVGLELKKALIHPHRHRGPTDRPVLFEPYYQNLIHEFCVAAFSVVEGLGAAHWLSRNGHDGADGRRIRRDTWLPVLREVYDPTGEAGLEGDVQRTVEVRDRLHQDQLGARAEIDWHAFSYEAAFKPASRAIQTLLHREADKIPPTSNLHFDDAP